MTTDLQRLTVPATRLWPGEAPWEGPLAVIDLDCARDMPDMVVIPHCPVIGLGDPGHPLAAKLDAVIEPPVSLETLAQQVLARPAAAAVVVQLLRLLAEVPAEHGLVAESLAYATLQGSAEHRAWLASQDRRPRLDKGRVSVELDGGTLLIALDDPANGNAIDRSMRDALYGAFTLAAINAEIATVRLAASGRCFSLGAELSEFGTTTDPATAHRIRGLTLPAHAAVRIADRLEVHVRGACVGAGLELAAWGRRVTAGAEAWFQLPELGMGLLPGAGGCVSLVRRIGRQRTGLMILSGKRLNARQALAWGLIDGIVDAADESGANIA